MASLLCISLPSPSVCDSEMSSELSSAECPPLIDLETFDASNTQAGRLYSFSPAALLTASATSFGFVQNGL